MSRGVLCRVFCLTATALFASQARAGAFAAQAAALDDPKNMTAVVAAGNAASADLLEALKGPRADLALEAIGRIGDVGAGKAIMPLASHADGEVRAAAAWALGRCADPATVATLVALSNDPYPPARVSAIGALVKFNTPDSDASLKSALTASDREVRLAAALSLQQSPRPTLLPALGKMLAWHVDLVKPKSAKPGAEPEEVVVWSEPSAQVRLAVIRVLGAAKIVDALPALITALERETSYNRLQIITAIEGMGEPAAGVCLGRIVPLNYDKDAFEKRMPLLVCNGTLAVIAGRLSDSRAVPFLLNTLKIPHTSLGADKDITELYIQTVVLLGKFKVEKAARPLAELIKDARVQQLSDATGDAIRLIGHAAARPLATNLDDYRFAPVFLRLLREPALRTFAAREGILKFLTHESDEVRFEATETLGLYLAEGILDEYDVPALEAMYLDHSRDVRASCAKWKADVAKKYGDDGK